MATKGSLSQTMDKAIQHYSSLFMLPPYKKVLSLLALTCIGGGFFSTVILSPSFDGLVNGLLLGFSLFFVSLAVDYVVSMLILRRESIYDLRRTGALSLFSWGLWLLFIFVGDAIALVTSSDVWLIRLCLLGFSAVTILRLVVLFSTSSMSYKRLLAASLLHPFSCIVPFLVFWTIDYSITSLTFFFIISSVVCLIASFLFISILNRRGMQTLGVPSLRFFKAFLLNWITGSNVLFEELLEKLGENRDVEVSLIKFSSSKPQAFIVVPSVHPGPFKNVGSSLLPSMLKNALERELNCVVCTPHGLLGHEFDLASQAQNQKIITRVVELVDFESFEARAAPFIKVSNGLATACCQVFDDFAFLSFTLAPRTTEDLPQELGIFVHKEARKHGLTHCVVVNAHNSVDEAADMQEALEALKNVAATCLEKAVSLKRLPFEVGAATVVPGEFGPKEGMGPGGITVVVVKVGAQKAAYVVIDGNNMITGLREVILSALHSIGIDEGEVFTTDTHSVNAIILSGRGYHPVGEAMNREGLMGYIKEATLSALSDLKSVKAACHSITVADVKVVGEKLLETLCLLIDRTLQKAKRVVVPIFATSGLILMLILMFV